MSKLSAQSISKSYKKRTVVDSVSLEIDSGTIVSLLGPNGAGKTTTFYMLCGLIRCDMGVITLDDKDISNWPMYQRAQAGIGYLPQESSIFRGLSVKQNILAVLELQKLNHQQRHQRADELLAEFSLEHVRDSLGGTLSGGERRRTEIARSLAANPRFILLDEPFAGVDPISVSDTKKLIRAVADRGIGIIITDHNVRETLQICDLAYIMNQGQLMASGSPEEVTKNPQVQHSYLGENFNLS